MNREDVIRMAREADPGFGNEDDDLPDVIYGIPAVERFAKLIADHVAEECRLSPNGKHVYFGNEAGCHHCRSLYKTTV